MPFPSQWLATYQERHCSSNDLSCMQIGWWVYCMWQGLGRAKGQHTYQDPAWSFHGRLPAQSPLFSTPPPPLTRLLPAPATDHLLEFCMKIAEAESNAPPVNQDSPIQDLQASLIQRQQRIYLPAPMRIHASELIFKSRKRDLSLRPSMVNASANARKGILFIAVQHLAGCGLLLTCLLLLLEQGPL